MKPNPPRLSDADCRRLTARIASGELAPALNHTKWNELIQAMLAHPEKSPQYRGHSVFAPPDYCFGWDGEWYYHIHPVAEIEWLDVRANDHSWLRAVLQEYAIPFSDEGTHLHIAAYLTPASQHP